MLVAILVDAVLGWPQPLYRVIGHPVTWMGRLIDRFETWLNLPETKDLNRRLAGVITALSVVSICVVLALVLRACLPGGWTGLLIEGLIAWPFLASRSLHDHVAAVARPLAMGDLTSARKAVAMIVGRDPDRLDEAGIARAAMESLSENASDGVVAPWFWGLVFGLPGIVGYKAINTLDSMIGHRTPRHAAFGWAAARIDDVANLIPARLTGLLIALVSGRWRSAWPVMWRDAGLHRSPNAGWPEAAMAGALAVRLSGPRVYADRVASEPWVNGTAADPTPQDLLRGLALFRRTVAALVAITAALAIAGWAG